MGLDKNIDKLIKKLDLKASTDLDQKIHSQIDNALARPKKTQPAQQPNIWKLIVKSKMTKITTAAVIIMAVLIGINQFGGSIEISSVAFAKVFAEIKKAVNQMPLMHKVLYTDRDGKEYYTENWYWFKSKSVLSKYVVDDKYFKISSLNYSTMENMVYDPDSDVVRVSYRVDVSPDRLPAAPGSIIGYYIEDYVRQEADICHEKGTYEGDDVEIYYFSIPRNFRDEREETEFIVNRNTHLPTLYKRKFWTPEGLLRFDQVISFDFTENGPKDIYDLGVPRTTEVVYDSESKKRLDKKMELLDDKAVYEERFREIYRLEEGEVLKYIPLSLAEPRIKIDEINNTIRILVREGSQIMPPLSHDEIKRMNEENHYTMFSWDGERAKRGGIFSDGVSIKTAFERIIVLSQFQYDRIPGTLSSIKIPGDWVIRSRTSKEQLLAAFETILRDFINRPIRFEKRQVELDVIVAREKFHFKPLSGTYDDNWIHIYSDKLDPDESGGGGSGTVTKFLQWVAGSINMPVIDETSSSNTKLSWGNHYSGYLRKIKNNTPEYNEKLDILLDNLTRQTGLIFTIELRMIEKWFVVE